VPLLFQNASLSATIGDSIIEIKYPGDAGYGFSIGATADIHSEGRLHLCNCYFQFTCLDFLFYIL
jgi:hypothetical protein